MLDDKPKPQRQSPRAVPISTTAEVEPAAVVFDANLWHKHLNVRRLTEHAARLAKSNIEVWVPEQVVLEWAEHAYGEIKQIEQAWARVETAGIVGPLPCPTSVHDVVADIQNTLDATPGVRVIRMTGAAAIEGIRDQILQTGPGRRDGSTKTGASDSSFVRDVITAAGDPSRVLFVSSNTTDIEAAARAAGHPTVAITKEQRMYKVLFGSITAPTTVTQLVISHLLSIATSTTLGVRVATENWVDVGNIDLSDDIEYLDYDVNVPRLEPYPTLVGISELDEVDSTVVGDQVTVTAEFNLILLGHIEVSGYTPDHDGRLRRHHVELPRMRINVPFIVDIVDIVDRHITMAPNGPAYATPSQTRFRNPLDGLDYVIRQLQALTGITMPADLTSLEEEFTLTSPSGRTCRVYRSTGDEPALHFDLDGREVVIASRFDHGVSIRDGREGFDIAPPYYLSSSATASSDEHYTALSQVWQHLVSP